MEAMELAQNLETAQERAKAMPPLQAELRAAKFRRQYPAVTSLVKELSSKPQALEKVLAALPQG